MSTQNEPIHFHVEPGEGQAELIIRHGDAARIDNPFPLKIAGSITAPAAWAAIRIPDPLKDHIEYNRNERLIEFYFNAREQTGGKISGSLTVHPDLVYLQINEREMQTLQDLSTTLKFSRAYFPDRDEHAKIITSLNNFKANVSTDLEQNIDQRGNSKQLKDKKVDSNVPTEFSLLIPLYIGEAPKKFRVEVCFDTTDGGTRVWLESVEMAELMMKERERIMNEQLAKFTDLVCIEK